MKCASCKDKECYQGKDCTRIKNDVLKHYEDPDTRRLLEVSSTIEATHYMKLTRVEEVMEFARQMGYHHLGLAFCVGLSEEAEMLEKILTARGFRVSSVCCKVCGIDKDFFHLPHIIPERFEAICNPVGQAMILNKLHTELNLIVGLCVGHDVLFTRYSQAPVTTLVVKDRVLGHNPLVAIYSRYYRRRL